MFRPKHPNGCISTFEAGFSSPLYIPIYQSKANDEGIQHLTARVKARRALQLYMMGLVGVLWAIDENAIVLAGMKYEASTALVVGYCQIYIYSLLIINRVLAFPSVDDSRRVWGVPKSHLLFM